MDNNILNNVPTLLGNSQNGGGKYKKSRSKGRKVRKTRVVKKGMVSRSRKPMRFGYFGGADQFMCTKIESQPTVPIAPAVIPPVAVTQPNPNPLKGGSKASRMMLAYRKYLKNMKLEKLQKIAESKGLKIKKRKNGKIVLVKKATIIRKLCERKHRKYGS